MMSGDDDLANCERALGMAGTPTVFISYSWDDDDHRSWVSHLAERLKAEGLNVRFDQWYNRPGDDIPAFMETAVRESDFVVVICTPRYKAAADNRVGGV